MLVYQELISFYTFTFMKFCLFLICLLLSSISIAQDYQCFYSNSSCFYSNSSIWENYVVSVDFDSVVVNGADTILFNYRQLPTDNYWELCFTDTTWLGPKLVLEPVWNVFFNANGDSIKIKTDAVLGETWKMHQQQNGQYIEATVDTIIQDSVLKMLANIKFITLQAYNNIGDSVANPYNSKTIKLSEDFGLIQFFDLIDFPDVSNPNSLTLIGLSNQNLGLQNFGASEVFDFDVADEFHYKIVSSNPLNPGWHTTYIYKLLTVIEKSVSANLDTLWYTYSRKKYVSSNSEFLGYSTSTTIDTVISEIVLSNYKNLDNRILEPKNEQYGAPINAFVPGFIDSYEKKSTNYGLIDTSSSCIIPIVGCVPSYYYYGKALGLTYLDGCCQTSSCQEYTELVYAKKGTIEYGTPLNWSAILSTKELVQKNSIQVFPNPFSENVTIQRESFEEIKIELLNSLGQVVHSEHPKSLSTTINTEQLPSGAYFLKVSSTNNIETFKLIK